MPCCDVLGLVLRSTAAVLVTVPMRSSATRLGEATAKPNMVVCLVLSTAKMMRDSAQQKGFWWDYSACDKVEAHQGNTRDKWSQTSHTDSGIIATHLRMMSSEIRTILLPGRTSHLKGRNKSSLLQPRVDERQKKPKTCTGSCLVEIWGSFCVEPWHQTSNRETGELCRCHGWLPLWCHLGTQMHGRLWFRRWADLGSLRVFF